MANDEWYYAKGNQQQGPVSLQAIQEMVRSGQIQPNDLVWRSGMANWQAASQVPEVYGGAPTPAGAPIPAVAYAPPGAPAPGSAPPPGTPQQYPQQPSYYIPQQVYPPGAVPNYLVPAILTIFCCQPFGIVSLVYAAQVNSKLAMGDYPGAMDCSNRAKTWAMWGVGIWVALMLGYVGLIVVMAIARA
jgi:hypothetical protein